MRGKRAIARQVEITRPRLGANFQTHHHLGGADLFPARIRRQTGPNAAQPSQQGFRTAQDEPQQARKQVMEGDRAGGDRRGGSRTVPTVNGKGRLGANERGGFEGF